MMPIAAHARVRLLLHAAAARSRPPRRSTSRAATPMLMADPRRGRHCSSSCSRMSDADRRIGSIPRCWGCCPSDRSCSSLATLRSRVTRARRRAATAGAARGGHRGALRRRPRSQHAAARSDALSDDADDREAAGAARRLRRTSRSASPASARSSSRTSRRSTGSKTSARTIRCRTRRYLASSSSPPTTNRGTTSRSSTIRTSSVFDFLNVRYVVLVAGNAGDRSRALRDRLRRPRRTDLREPHRAAALLRRAQRDPRVPRRSALPATPRRITNGPTPRILDDLKAETPQLRDDFFKPRPADSPLADGEDRHRRAHRLPHPRQTPRAGRSSSAASPGGPAGKSSATASA